jgi:hypothetical protein
MFLNVLPVNTERIVRHAYRRIDCSVGPRIPRAAMDASSTPAGAACDSKYFCTTKPPIERPITTGLVGSLSATSATSST